MRVGITTFGGDGGKSGISRYIVRLVEQFAAFKDGPEFEVVVYEDEESIFVPLSDRIKPLRFGGGLRNPILNLAWHQVGLPWLCRKRNFDVLFLPAANRRLPYWVPCPTLGTVHDFSSIHVEDKYDPARMFFIKRVTPVLIRKLGLVLTVSESSKKDIVSLCGIPEDRVVVTPNGVDLDVFKPRNRDDAAAGVQLKYGVRPPYILYVSRIEHPGKNHVRLIQAFNRLKASTDLPHQLVLGGSAWSRADEVYKVAAESPYAHDIAFIGFVDESDVPSLYCGAEMLVFPSLYEGFGMPILEAMACGAPVACSNLSAMPEVAGDAALLFDPYDEEDMCNAMLRTLTDQGLRDHLVRGGLERSGKYCWSNTAAKTMDAIRRVWEENR